MPATLPVAVPRLVSSIEQLHNIPRAGGRPEIKWPEINRASYFIDITIQIFKKLHYVGAGVFTKRKTIQSRLLVCMRDDPVSRLDDQRSVVPQFLRS